MVRYLLICSSEFIRKVHSPLPGCRVLQMSSDEYVKILDPHLNILMGYEQPKTHL